MLLILFLNMEKGHTFAFPKIICILGEKVQRQRRLKTIKHIKSTLKTSLKHIIQNCYFMVGKSTSFLRI